MQRERPQGFEVGKRWKRGIYECLWGCGESFTSRRQAERHPNCPGRKKNMEDIKQMYIVANQAPPEFCNQDDILKFELEMPAGDMSTGRSSNSNSSSSGSSGSETDGQREQSYEEIREYFKTIRKVDKDFNPDVANWLMTNVFAGQTKYY